MGNGDTVVSMLDNNIDAIVTWLAINKLCAVSVPINTALRGDFLLRQIGDAASSMVICEGEYLPRVLEIVADLPGLQRLLYRAAGPVLVPAPSHPGIVIAPLAEHRGSVDTPLENKPLSSDLACMIYTSGTTGPSKGCMLSYNYMGNIAPQQLRAGPSSCRSRYIYCATSCGCCPPLAGPPMARPQVSAIPDTWSSRASSA